MKSFLLLFALLGFLAVNAQIPNPGFESWTSIGSYEVPDSWGNLNNSTAATGVFTVTKGTSAPASGAAFIKIATRDIGGNTIVPGTIVNGQLDPVTFKPLSGLPCTSRPEKLMGKWQYMGYGTDAATIAAWLTRWNNATQQRDTIASLSGSPSGMLHSWGDFSYVFQYRSSSNPDTAVVLISSSGKVPVKNSFIWIDDLAFEGTVTSVNEKEPAVNVSVYPNPANQFVKIGLNAHRDGLARIVLTDNLGNMVMERSEEYSEGNNQFTLDLSSSRIFSGIYFVKLYTAQGTLARKVIVRK